MRIIGQQNVIFIAYNEYLWAKDRFHYGASASHESHSRIASMLLRPEEKFTMTEIKELHEIPECFDQDAFAITLWNFSKGSHTAWKTNFNMLIESIHRLETLKQMFINSCPLANDDRDGDDEEDEECDSDIEINI